MGLWPTQGDEKRFLFSGSASLPPCHPDRSAAQWRDLRFGGSPLEMFFDRAAPYPSNQALTRNLISQWPAAALVCPLNSTLPGRPIR